MIKILLTLLMISSAHAECDIAFYCNGRQSRAMINGRNYPIVCGNQTGRGIDGGEIGYLIKANGRWRPGLVRPGTPMITTTPRLCYDCFIHVSDISRSSSNGCLGTTSAAFEVLKACGGSKFSIVAK